jgi:general secretion pathway protein J
MILPYRNRERGRQAGFTLIEVIIAIGIMAVMMMMVSETLSNVIKLKARASRRSEMRHVLYVAVSKITDDLAMAFLADGTLQGKDGYYLTSFVAESDKMSLSTMSNIHYLKNARDSDQVRVGYELIKNDEGGTDLIRRQTDHLTPKIDKGGRRYVLLKNVKTFDLQYYDSNKKEWVPQWDTDSISAVGRLPQMVKVKIEVTDQEDEEDDNSIRDYTYEVSIPLPLYKDKLNF